MSLSQVEPGRFVLEGDVTFETASVIEARGMVELKACSAKEVDHWIISLSGIGQADSSALSVCLSWLRYARQQQVRLCFTDIPRELHALARVCGIHDLLINVSCPP